MSDDITPEQLQAALKIVLRAAGETKQVGSGIVLKPGMVPPIKLSGDVLTIELLNYYDGEVMVKYPDGHQHCHQAQTVMQLLLKVSGQLRTRYNLATFEFRVIPNDLTSGQIVLEKVTYA